MPDLEAVCGPSRGHVKCKLATGVSVVLVAVLIACIADSYHKIHEGNVGIYYKHGALQVTRHWLETDIILIATAESLGNLGIAFHCSNYSAPLGYGPGFHGSYSSFCNAKAKIKF